MEGSKYVFAIDGFIIQIICDKENEIYFDHTNDSNGSILIKEVKSCFMTFMYGYDMCYMCVELCLLQGLHSYKKTLLS